MSAHHTDDFFSAVLERNLALARKRREELNAFLAAQPQAKPCSVHPNTQRPIDLEASERASRDNALTAKYAPCPECIKAADVEREIEFLRKCGVPFELTRATLENWKPRTDQEREHLASVRRFLACRRGFLVMLGGFGLGKTHLAVSALRQFRRPFMVKQSELLRMQRQTYRDKAAVDPVGKCQDADCLLLDEIGLSAGGRDELTLLHDVLDYRHGEMLPTILTGNVSPAQLREVLGERIADRLRQSATVLLFSGTSNRPEARARYFEGGF